MRTVHGPRLGLVRGQREDTFDPKEPWSGSIIGSKPDTGIEMMAHIALTSLCEDRLAATATLPIVLLPIQNQGNPVWPQGPSLPHRDDFVS
jgi:hypothetical protein